jgi:hypothetical protein
LRNYLIWILCGVWAEEWLVNADAFNYTWDSVVARQQKLAKTLLARIEKAGRAQQLERRGTKLSASTLPIFTTNRRKSKQSRAQNSFRNQKLDEADNLRYHLIEETP